MRIVVDFPAPLGPTNPVTWPGRTVNVRSSTATVAPYRLRRPPPRSLGPWHDARHRRLRSSRPRVSSRACGERDVAVPLGGTPKIAPRGDARVARRRRQWRAWRRVRGGRARGRPALARAAELPAGAPGARPDPGDGALERGHCEPVARRRSRRSTQRHAALAVLLGLLATAPLARPAPVPVAGRGRANASTPGGWFVPDRRCAHRARRRCSTWSPPRRPSRRLLVSRSRCRSWLFRWEPSAATRDATPSAHARRRAGSSASDAGCADRVGAALTRRRRRWPRALREQARAGGAGPDRPRAARRRRPPRLDDRGPGRDRAADDAGMPPRARERLRGDRRRRRARRSPRCAGCSACCARTTAARPSARRSRASTSCRAGRRRARRRARSSG